MKINSDIENLMCFFGVYGGAMFNDEITTYNRYLGRLYELKFELEEALDECNNEINKIQKERNDELLTIQNKMVREVAEQEKQNKLK